MKVFVLGGYGAVGLQAAKLLARSGLVSEFAIAGRNLERARKAAAEIDGKVTTVFIDGTDEAKLSSLVASYDIVINTAFNDSVLPAIRASIRAGTHYCDANTIVDQAIGLSPEAESAGITSIVATGVAPCITNMLARHIARNLDEIEQFLLCPNWILNFKDKSELTPMQLNDGHEQSLAALGSFRSYFTWIFTVAQKNEGRSISTFQNGRWTEVDPCKSGFVAPLLQGGTITAYPFFAGDIIFPSLPLDIATKPPVEMEFSLLLPSTVRNVLRKYTLRVIRGELDAEGATDGFFDTIAKDPQQWMSLSGDKVELPQLWIQALGRKGGRPALCTCWYSEDMWHVGGYFLTSVSLATAVCKMLRGEVPGPGVMAAEKAFEPMPFLEEVVSFMPDRLPEGCMFNESFEWLDESK